MIDPSDFEAIDKNYFEIIGNNDYCITIRSRNTLHEWHLMERIANGHRTFVISHRHGPSAPYHLQQNRPTVEACCDYIRVQARRISPGEGAETEGTEDAAARVITAGRSYLA